MAYTCTGAEGAGSLGTLASGLWLNSLGQPTSISALSISGYFAQNYVVGQLNAKISTCYSGSNGGSGANWAICPNLDDSELAILGYIYLSTYWIQKVASAAGAGGISDTFTVLREGDSSIQRTSPAELMKIYSAMARQANEQLNYLTNEYIRNGQGSVLPRSIEMPTIIFSSNTYPGS